MFPAVFIFKYLHFHLLSKRLSKISLVPIKAVERRYYVDCRWCIVGNDESSYTAAAVPYAIALSAVDGLKSYEIVVFFYLL